MATIIDTLVTDRTQGDVDELKTLLAAGEAPADHKGAYNTSDLNRVGQAVAYLLGRLATIGIRATATIKTDWTEMDIPTVRQMETYLANVDGFRAKLRDYRPGAVLPGTMRHLDWSGANDIETMLRETEIAVTRILLSFRGYAGRLRSGVDCLP